MKYYRPSTLTEALTLLREPGSAPLAGGTVLLPERPAELAAVVDLSALGLDALRREGGFLVAGAMARVQALATFPGLDG
ncbi:MAG TPA: carbon monoxide dehydrogenase, partial [Chloroflexi bacterium]|nr:carbon monoxide dehydrogenase [Chloroflexota bacterium]